MIVWMVKRSKISEYLFGGFIILKNDIKLNRMPNRTELLFVECFFYERMQKMSTMRKWKIFFSHNYNLGGRRQFRLLNWLARGAKLAPMFHFKIVLSHWSLVDDDDGCCCLLSTCLATNFFSLLV